MSESRLSRLEATSEENTKAIARLEVGVESIKEGMKDLKEAVVAQRAGGTSVWQKSLIGMLVVQSLMHGAAPPDVVKDILGMLKGGH